MVCTFYFHYQGQSNHQNYITRKPIKEYWKTTAMSWRQLVRSESREGVGRAARGIREERRVWLSMDPGRGAGVALTTNAVGAE
jgi:hypothetical protein